MGSLVCDRQLCLQLQRKRHYRTLHDCVNRSYLTEYYLRTTKSNIAMHWWMRVQEPVLHRRWSCGCALCPRCTTCSVKLREPAVSRVGLVLLGARGRQVKCAIWELLPTIFDRFFKNPAGFPHKWNSNCSDNRGTFNCRRQYGPARPRRARESEVRCERWGATVINEQLSRNGRRQVGSLSCECSRHGTTVS